MAGAKCKAKAKKNGSNKKQMLQKHNNRKCMVDEARAKREACLKKRSFDDFLNPATTTATLELPSDLPLL